MTFVFFRQAHNLFKLKLWLYPLKFYRTCSHKRYVKLWKMSIKHDVHLSLDRPTATRGGTTRACCSSCQPHPASNHWAWMFRWVQAVHLDCTSERFIHLSWLKDVLFKKISGSALCCSHTITLHWHYIYSISWSRTAPESTKTRLKDFRWLKYD